MSSNIWQIWKQCEQYSHGRTTTERINSYVEVWRNRCYSDDIPDDAPKKLRDSLRVPSYRAIAECILRNDLKLYGLGFRPEVKPAYLAVKKLQKQ